LYLNWHSSLKDTAEQNRKSARSIATRISVFIDDLFQDLYALPIYGQELKVCDKALLDHLEHITMNNPVISGIIIFGNQGSFLCSTLPKPEEFKTLPRLGRGLQGPFSASDFEQKAYLIQQNIGGYSVGLVILASVLKSIIETKDHLPQRLILSSEIDKKYLMDVERITNKHWDFTRNKTHRPDSKSHGLEPAVEKISTLNKVLLFVHPNPRLVIRNLLLSELSLLFFLSVFMTVLYFALNNLISSHYSLRNALKIALKNKQFYPVYQPIYDHKASGYAGAEVLLRWQGEEEVLLPEYFIHEAELSGLIVPISLHIMELAIEQAKALWKEFPEFYLAFNLSALHFLDGSFFQDLRVLFKQHQIRPQQILFEITERNLLDPKNEVFLHKMRELRAEGFPLAVDDYGTGHANISYLQLYPFTHLKIDQIFIQAIGTQALTECLNHAIIQMAKDLHLTIVAEGVETQEHVNYLTAQGVYLLQGWYYSKAITMNQLILLKRSGSLK
jgi:sensor c-di-GMP phosphodiesterase-like protein